MMPHKADHYAFAPEAAGTTGAVNVLLPVRGDVPTYNERHLLHVEPAAPQVACDHNRGSSLAEGARGAFAFRRQHGSVNCNHGEPAGAHLVGEPIYLLPRAAEHNALKYLAHVVNVAQGIEFPLLALNKDEELLHVIQTQLVALHEHANWIHHELICECQRVPVHCR